MQVIKCDICVIGGGSGGLSVAAGASQMGADTVLIEAGKMGGDCLNYGCVPSKAVIAAAKKAQLHKNADQFGVTAEAPQVDYAAVMDHVHDVIAGIEPHDSVERFEGLGVNVIQGFASFKNAKQVEVNGQLVEAKRFVIATGSSAAIPPINGLNDVSYLTNESLFENRVKPEHLIVIGGGPIGMEMAQAHRRLGSKVTVLEVFSVLAKDDSDLTAIALDAIRAEGVQIHEGVKIEKISEDGPGKIIVDLQLADGTTEQLNASHLLVAAGRKPNLSGLNLEAAGIDYKPNGIAVDARLRTTNKKVFAIGDVAGGLQFTHVAGYHAGIVIRNALFKLPAKADHSNVPWVTYTDPEIANVGLTEDAARKIHGDSIRVLEFEYAENDRARCERISTGKVKAITDKKGRILGAGIVGIQAGEIIQMWVLAMNNGLKTSSMASFISPYPTLSEVNKRAAGSFYTPKLFSEKTKKIVRFLSKF